MSINRYSAKVDDNQPGIVKALRKHPDITVQPKHDDILVGYQGKNYQIEIKDPAKTLRQDGLIKPGIFKKTQIDLMSSWKGQYDVAWYVEEILEIIGCKPEN